ncbi:T9SS C-terminal target domain-containing protein [Flavobacterium columnare]|uniref:T9SS C-terminal target domain-containing protein n=1 Tax=Flavobacterium columnare TaxID=996 RepID=A0A437UDE8_9FLAO|nr:zinc-dependent metalloprotease [Flavobacterium columnare]RVU91615.1 T9SS C-terminal target domain-containing protein [Flavobacterium columnare]
MKIIFKLFLVISVLGFAQDRKCGTQSYMEEYLKDPKNKAIHYDLQEKFKARLLKGTINKEEANKLADPIRIPVAAHFPALTSVSDEVKKCIISLVQSQLDVLNADYNASNKDISKWNENAGLYRNVFSGKMEVEFVLATKNHPKESGLVDGAPAVTFGTDFLNNSDSDLTWKGYMNLVVRQIPKKDPSQAFETLGYSVLGGRPSQGHTVVINTFSFGSGVGCPGYQPLENNHLGRTLTHELGHFLNLEHTFGNNGGCATADDGIADTPKVGKFSVGCPVPGSVSGCVANEKALTMNYMDYVDDACMYMFTQGQTAAMKAYYNVISSQFVKDVFDKAPVVVTIPVQKKEFNIYPVPFGDVLNITFEKVPASCTIQVIDRIGRIVYEENDTQVKTEEKYDLSFLETGVYFLNLKFGNEEIVKKVSKL